MHVDMKIKTHEHLHKIECEGIIVIDYKKPDQFKLQIKKAALT